MSVIGYDGKIRPKSVAVNYKPQGMMSPEQMERIHAAKPDYVSGVMKMFDSINANMSDTIGYFDKERKEREAVEHSEKKLDLNKRLSDIENNPDLTPAQKEEQRQAIAGEVESGSNPGKFNTIGRARKNELMAIVQGSAERIQLEANRTEAGMRAANLEAGLNTVVSNANTDLQAWMVEQILKNPNLKLEDLQGLLEKRFDEFAGPDATNGLRPLELAEYKKNRSLWIGGNMVVFGKILGDKNREKNAQNIAVSSFAKAASAKTGSEAWNAGNDIAGQYVGNTIDENGQIQNANGTFIMWLNRKVDENVTEYDRIIANVHDSYSAKTEELGAEGAARWAASEIERAEKLLFDTRNFIQLSCDDAYKALEGAHGGKLMQAEKDYYKTFLQDNADALKKQLDKTVGQKKVNAAATVRKAEKEKGMNDFDALRNFWGKKSTSLPEHLIPVYRKFDPEQFGVQEQAAQAEGYNKETREKMQRVLFSQRYAGVPEADQKLAFVYDSMGTIAGLDMGRNSAQNLNDIVAIVDSVGLLCGYGSDEHKMVVQFAFENIQKEKNSMGNQAVAHANKLFLNGHTPQSDEGRAILNSDPKLYKRYYQFLTLAQEIPYDGSVWFDKVGQLETVARQMKAFDGITTAAGFQQGVVAAFDTAKKMSEEKAGAASSVVVKTKWEDKTDRTMSAFDEEADAIGARAVVEYLEAHPDAPYGKIRRAKEEAISDYWYGKAKEITSGFAAIAVRIGQTRYTDENISKNRNAVREELLYQNKNYTSSAEYGKKIRDELAAVESEIKEAGLEGEYRSAVGPAKSAFGSYNEYLEKIKIGRDLLKKHREKKARASKEEMEKNNLIEDSKRIVANRETRKFFKEVSAGELVTKNYGLREDGTRKGPGWFSPIELPDGSVMTEVSITIEKNGVSVDVPMITPMTTKKELDFLARTANTRISEMSKEDKKVFDGIAEKAVKWAEQRWAEKKSPYIMKGEEFVPLPKDEEGGEKK